MPLPTHSPRGVPYWRPGGAARSSPAAARPPVFHYPLPGLPPIAQWIRRRREAEGLSQTAFANRIGVAQSVVSRWESGVRIPNAHLLAALRAAFGEDPPMDGLVKGS